MLPGSKRIVGSFPLAAGLLWFSAVAWAGQGGESNLPLQETQPSFHLRTGEVSETTLVDPRSIPVPDRSETLLREPPTIHGELHFGEQTANSLCRSRFWRRVCDRTRSDARAGPLPPEQEYPGRRQRQGLCAERVSDGHPHSVLSYPRRAPALFSVPIASLLIGCCEPSWTSTVGESRLRALAGPHGLPTARAPGRSSRGR